MKKQISLLALSLVFGTGLALAGPPTIDTQAVDVIQSRLNHAQVQKHGDVQVTYENGVATLTGTVDSVASKLDAEKAAKKAPGVSQVVDNIQVFAQGVGEQQILQGARHEVVMYYAYGIFDNVELRANGNTLTVSGQVTQPFKKADMGRLLERVKGVATLQNNLEVLPLSSFDDRLRLQLAHAIYGDPFFTKYANQAVPPIHIIVNNGNVTLEGAVANSMDKIKAGLTANHTGLSFAVVNNLRVDRS